MPDKPSERVRIDDRLAVAMEDIDHILMCATPDDCEHCAAARDRSLQYRETGYPRPGAEYTIRIPKSKDPGSCWVSGRKVLSIEPGHPKPVRYRQLGCKLTGRCTLEEWSSWAKTATVVKHAK